MVVERKQTLVKQAQIVLLIMSCIFFLYGAYSAHKAGVARDFKNAAQEFEVIITEKSNAGFSSYSAYFDFGFVIENNSDKTAKYIEGTMQIMDRNQNLLSSRKVTFESDFTPGSEKLFNLSWEMDNNQNAFEIWESDIDDLVIFYDIETITFDNWESVDVDLEPFVKPSR